MPQQVVDLARTQHAIISLLTVDRSASRIGEVTHQLVVFVLRQSLEHGTHVPQLPGNGIFFLAVDTLQDFSLVLLRVSEILVTLVLAQLPVYLLFTIRCEMDTGKRIRKLLNLTVGHILEHVKQGATRLCQQIGFVGWER